MDGAELFDKLLNWGWKAAAVLVPMLVFKDFINNSLNYIGLRWNNKPYSAIGGMVKRDGVWWEVREINLTHVKLIRRSEDDEFVFNEVMEIPTARYVKDIMHYMEYRIPKKQLRGEIKNGNGESK